MVDGWWLWGCGCWFNRLFAFGSDFGLFCCFLGGRLTLAFVSTIFTVRKEVMKVRVCDGRFKVLMNLGWLWVLMKVCGVGLVIRR